MEDRCNMNTDPMLTFGQAIVDNAHKSVKQLLRDGACPNVRTYNYLGKFKPHGNCSAAFLACRNDTINTLLQHSEVDITAVYAKGNTLLHESCTFQNAPAVQLLLQRGAEVDARADDGFTPFMVAAHCNDLESMRHLIQFGADVTSTASSGWATGKSAHDLSTVDISGLLRREVPLNMGVGIQV